MWVPSKLAELRKASAWGRQKPLLHKAIYLAEPEKDYKDVLRTREAELLRPPGYAGLAAAALDLFITDLEAARSARLRAESGGSR